MWSLFKVAFRNVGRNKRRSLITITTIFIGVVVICGVRGLLNGLQDEIRSGLARKIHGDVQLHKTGYRNSIDTSPYKIMFSYDAALQAKLRDYPMIKDVAPRLRLVGLLNHQRTQSTLPVMIQGFDSRHELVVCPRAADSVVQGRMLDSAQERQAVALAENDLAEATFLDAPGGEPSPSVKNTTGYHQALLSADLFKGLGAALGDEVVVLLNDKNNMQQALIATVTGVVDFALPTAEAKILWLDYHTLQNSLALHDEVSELALAITPDTSADAAVADLQAMLGKDLVAETYLELSGFLKDVMTIQNGIFNVIIIIVFAIVISAIVNTSLMTVMERIREIGTLMALGYRRRHILFLFLAESALIGVIGALTGLAVAGTVLGGLSMVGIDVTLPGQQVATVLYPRVPPGFLLFVMVLAIGSALAAAFVPAYRASLMRPVDALNKS